MTGSKKSSRVPMLMFGLSCVGMGYALANFSSQWAQVFGSLCTLVAVFSGVITRSRSNY